MRFKSNSDTIRLIMEDSSGRKLSSFRIAVHDKKAIASAFRAINEEYGLGLVIKMENIYEDYDEKYHL